jgi:hypothetical protein
VHGRVVGSPGRPLDLVAGGLRASYEADDDLGLLAALLVHLLGMIALWSFVGGAVQRLAAVHLARGRPESGRAALAFARRRWLLLAWGGSLPGWAGGLILPVAIVGVTLLALAAVVGASVVWVGGFLTGPTVACEDSDAFDAVSRVVLYAHGAGLPRVLALRALFLGGVLLGSSWRLLRTLAAGALAWVVLRAGAGADGLERAGAILAAMGPPPDAARLGVGALDYAAAAALALAGGGLAALWLADLASRAACARVAVYLLLRRELDRTPIETLATPPRREGPLAPGEAGFEEVGRVEG